MHPFPSFIVIFVISTVSIFSTKIRRPPWTPWTSFSYELMALLLPIWTYWFERCGHWCQFKSHKWDSSMREEWGPIIRGILSIYYSFFHWVRHWGQRCIARSMPVERLCQFSSIFLQKLQILYRGRRRRWVGLSSMQLFPNLWILWEGGCLRGSVP